MYPVYTWYIMVYIMSEHGISLFGQLETLKVQFSLQTRVSPLGTRLYHIMIAIYSAYRQESANLYIHCLE